MQTIDQFPKSIKKAIRYIKQEAPKEQLPAILKLFESAIKLRNQNNS